MADEPTHSCPAGCGLQVPHSMLACKEDWFRLPSGHRFAVNRTYPRRDWAPVAYEAARTAALAWFRDNPRVVQ